MRWSAIQAYIWKSFVNTTACLRVNKKQHTHNYSAKFGVQVQLYECKKEAPQEASGLMTS